MHKQNWFWACSRDEQPAADRFVIANGQDKLWSRVRREIDDKERVFWMNIHSGKSEPDMADMLNLAVHIVPNYLISHNAFVREAAQIPVFAQFLRSAPDGLCNYVSNPVLPVATIAKEPYTDAEMRRLGRIVSGTLDIEDDWF
jgi:hypothetical protein